MEPCPVAMRLPRRSAARRSGEPRGTSTASDPCGRGRAESRHGLERLSVLIGELERRIARHTQIDRPGANGFKQVLRSRELRPLDTIGRPVERARSQHQGLGAPALAADSEHRARRSAASGQRPEAEGTTPAQRPVRSARPSGRNVRVGLQIRCSLRCTVCPAPDARGRNGAPVTGPVAVVDMIALPDWSRWPKKDRREQG
jgi:hypothetical protein